MLIKGSLKIFFQFLIQMLFHTVTEVEFIKDKSFVTLPRLTYTLKTFMSNVEKVQSVGFVIE